MALGHSALAQPRTWSCSCGRLDCCSTTVSLLASALPPGSCGAACVYGLASLSIGKPQLPSGMRGLAPGAGALAQPRERGRAQELLSLPEAGHRPSQALCGWRDGRAGGLPCLSWGSWGLGEGAREQERSEPARKMAAGRVAAGGRTSASKQLCVPEAAGPWVFPRQLQIQQQVAARASLQHCPQRSGVALAASESVAQRQGGSLGHGGSCPADDDIGRMSLPGDCDHPREGRRPVVPHRGPGLTVATGTVRWGPHPPPSWAWPSSPEVPCVPQGADDGFCWGEEISLLRPGESRSFPPQSPSSGLPQEQQAHSCCPRSAALCGYIRWGEQGGATRVTSHFGTHRALWSPAPAPQTEWPSCHCWGLLLGCPKRVGCGILGGQPLLPPALSGGMGRCDLQALELGSVEVAARSLGPYGHFLISGCPCYRFHCFDREIHPEEWPRQRH